MAVEYGEVPDPVMDPSQVLIEVHAAGITFPDVLMTRGRYQMKPDLPFVPGLQVAGIVRRAPEASGFSEGDRVCAFTFLGGFCELVVADPTQVFALPDTMSWSTGAAALVNYLTAHFVLLKRGHVVAGETVLIHGAGGGLGLATIQLAKALGARVLAVVSTPEKAAAARRSGADETLPVEGFLEAAREVTGGLGVNLVIDPVGGDRFTDSLRCLATSGSLIVVGFAAGEIPTVRVNRLLLKNISVIGAAWGAHAMTTPGYAQSQWAELTELFTAGTLNPEISVLLPLAEASEGLRQLEEREAVGNVVLQVR